MRLLLIDNHDSYTEKAFKLPGRPLEPIRQSGNRW